MNGSHTGLTTGLKQRHVTMLSIAGMLMTMFSFVGAEIVTIAARLNQHSRDAQPSLGRRGISSA
ncbi:hypothetical protein LGM65_20805 [Burkholderia anthina]|uniref:hypothetical protein n=1 Tax=Burkholderia anthina TaxID=179879 RepID=UPI001CF17F9A|nr:hypothetical protein [Burkholderia anthina]MCA8093299.1 hypothetical protein [Burkholderia anthina]